MGENFDGISPELYKAIVTIVDDRVKEIKVTRQDFDGLKRAVEELAQAQKRTEKALEELVQAQTETARQVGRLSLTIGFGLEDIAHVVLPGYLQRHFSIQMGEFERRFFPVSRGMSLEVNLYAEGKQNGRRLTILGEAKSRIHAREVRQFQRVVEKVTPQLSYPPFKVMFAYIIYPDAIEEAKRHEMVLVASYQR